MGRFRRLTREKRYHLQKSLERGVSLRTIAKDLELHASSLSREIKRSAAGKAYDFESAEQLAWQRRRAWQAAHRKLRGELENEVLHFLLDKLSPEQIAKAYGKISHSSIYRYIARNQLNKLLRTLRKQRKDRKKKHWKPSESSLGKRKMIEERPAIVERRTRAGDWERDFLLGKAHHRSVLVLVNRVSRKVKLALLPRLNADLTHQKTIQLLSKEVVKTITNDNGTEFARHKKTEAQLKAKIYFSHRYKPWQRGSVENMCGLLRQYFPRKKPIPNLSYQQLKKIQDQLNRRPRKCLGFKTPSQVHERLQSRVLR